MTREDILDELVSERYGAPVRQHTGPIDGPTAQLQKRERLISEVHRLYHDVKLPTADVADALGLPWHEVVGIIEGWSTP